MPELSACDAAPGLSAFCPSDIPLHSVRLSDGGRLSALRQSRLLDTPPEPAFDRLTALAQRILSVPICLVSLVEPDRQFFKSQQGLSEPLATTRETPISHSFCQYVVASGAPFVVDDARAHPLVRDNGAVCDFGVSAYLGVPLRSPEGDVLGSFCAIDTVPRAWTDDDRAVLLDLAAMAEDQIALRAEVATRARIEAQYRALFESSPDAVLVLEPLTESVLDANGSACALYRRTRDELVGSTMRGASPDSSPGETAIAQLLVDGGAVQFESVHTRADGTAFDVAIRASLVRMGASPVVVSVNRDVSERNRTEQTLRASLAEAAFRETLNAALRPLTDPADIHVAAARVLGGHLGASRVFYAEVGPDGERFVVARDYRDGVASVAGVYALSDYGPAVAGQLRAGQPLVVGDFAADEGLTDAEREAYDALAVRAYVSFPLVKEGRLIALFTVHRSEPWVWGPGEVALIGETAERTWAASERAHAEAALRDSEEQFRMLADTATDVILTIDTSSTIRYANRAAEAVFGYRPDELVGASLTALMPAGLRPRHHAGIDRYARTGIRGLPWNLVETRGLRKDGTEIRIAISFGEYVVGGERLFTGIIRDTTAQKATEEALKQSEAQFRQIAEALPQLVWTSQPDGTHDFYNGRWYAYTGMTPGEPDCQWKDYVHPDDWLRSGIVWEHSLATGEPYEAEYRIRCAADGEYRWFIGRAEPVRNEAGEVVRWFGTSTDVHDLFETRERLQAKGEQLRLVHRATTDVVWDLDAESGTVAWSSAIAGVLGWEDAVGGTDLAWWQDRVHPDDCARVVDSLAEATEGDAATWQEEYRFQRADGAYVYVLDRGYVVRDPDGVVVRMVGAMVDLTERKAFETELVLAREVAETAARLKSSLLANMSHEIRTPLTAILGYAEMLADEAPPDLQDLVEPIARGGRRLMDTLDSVLDLAQIEAGERVLSVRPVGLLAEAEGVCRALRPLADAKGLDLRVVGAAPAAFTDGPALRRVLTNLVGNAVKFTDAGSVTVDVGADGPWAVVRVADTGVGIAADFLPDLFAEFKQESEGHERRFEGSGLGLAITKRLVGLMGGEVSVESRKGAGSVFTVRLPLATAATAPAGVAVREAA